MSTYGLWLSTAGMKVNDHRQTLIANNIANAHTAGFKHDLAVISQRRTESAESIDGAQYMHPVLSNMAGGVNVEQPYYSHEQGSIEHTGRPLDIAIQGEGFFEVNNGKDTRYTRSGEFTLNRDGQVMMVNEAGDWRLQSEQGTPLTVDPAGEPITVSADGTMRQGETLIGTVALKSNADADAMCKVGENLFESTRGEMESASGSMVPNSREASTFNAIQGLATLIEATRSYQLNATMLQLQDQMTGQTVTTLGRVA